MWYDICSAVLIIVSLCQEAFAWPLSMRYLTPLFKRLAIDI
jgi:hypothetical protein